jgi:DNA-binding transcriptional MerR regulator
MSASPSATPSHLSIGDVLNLLRDEFPDITISKIRFLESQGLIDPERTPSGYRKFYDADVARLRWILHQQKEHFLPLKVIKERLDRLQLDPDALDARGGIDDGAAGSAESRAEPQNEPEGEAEVEPAVEPDVESEPAAGSAPHVDVKRAPEPTPDADAGASPGGNGDTAPARRPRRRTERREVAIEAPMLPLADTGERDEAVAPPGRAAPTGGVSLTRAELAAAAGLADAQVVELESFGLLTQSPQSGDHPLFDEEALTIARMAAGFYAHGIEARHLRMYKHFAQREAALFEQVLLPYLRQRNPEARAKGQRELAELARLGRGLRAALLVTVVREAIAD